jgi:hypothetical protein
MKRLVGFGLIIVTIVLTSVFAPQPALAKNLQQGSTWTAGIAYFNPTAEDGELTVSYYPEGGSGFTPTQLNVNSHYSGMVLVGATPGTEGSAVLSSNFQMPAVYTIAANSGNPYGVITLEFFNSDQVGAQYFYLPVVRKAAGGLTSRIGIQNIENQPVDMELRFVASDDSTTTVTLQNIPAQSSAVFKTSDAEFSSLADGFDGSLMISATIDGTGAPARVVAASADVETSTDQVIHSYQGASTFSELFISLGTSQVSLPVVFCNYGRTGLSTKLHVQNISGTDIDLPGDLINADSITIEYYDAVGQKVEYTSNNELAYGRKDVIDVCAAGELVEGRQLSARITHASAKMAVVMETTSNQGLSATTISYSDYCDGDCKIALPYVEWSSSSWDFQTKVYIMNTGVDPATINATWFRRDGTGEEQIFSNVPPYALVETNPTQVSDLMNMTHRDFKGAVLLESTQPIMALVLVTKSFQNPDGSILTRGDSYMGLLYTP